MKQAAQRGANMVEAAFVLPILFFLIFGIIEFGHAFSVYQTMTNAAREGARRSVAPPPGPGATLISATAVKNAVCNYLLAGGVACTGPRQATVSVCQSCPGASAAAECTATCNPNYSGAFNSSAISYTQVDVSYPYQFLFIPVGPVTLKTQVVMRNEND